MAKRNYWLLKTEPGTFAVDDFEREKNRTTMWEGVRNYQARNLLRDELKPGDLALIYHSSAKPPGIAGIAQVVREGYPDFTAFESKNKYYDPKSDPDNPRWFMVDVKLEQKFERLVSLEEIKQVPALSDMVLVNNSRLSVQPVRKKEFDRIVKMAGVKIARE